MEQQAFCPHCGSPRQEWARFCGKCGNAYDAPPGLPAPAVAAQALPAASAGQTAPVTALGPETCPSCGAPQLVRDRGYCLACGRPYSAPPARKGGGPRTLTIVALVVAVGVLLFLAFTIGLGAGFRSGATSAGGSPASMSVAGSGIPSAGDIWFGDSFDPSTFVLRTRQTTVRVGETLAVVAHLTQTVSPSQANLQVAVGGATVVNEGINGLTGPSDIIGLTYTAQIAGTYTFRIADVGGNVLASGSITVTQ